MMCSTTEVLEQKRKQLEQEITDFRIQKENEYRTFEWQLLEDTRDPTAHTARQRENDGPPVTTSSRKHLKHHGTFGIKATGEMRQHTGDISDSLDETKDIAQVDAQKPLSTESNGLRDPVTGSSSRTRFHEREQEFQGLFTPSYLPLLDSKAKLELKSNGAGKLNQGSSTSISLGSREDSRGSDGVQTNSTYSSASFPDSHFRPSLSPTPAHILSASLPRQPVHQRTSSSRSDTSLASLRSSLRDPNQPRSPKRVLFSIDNLVVSPSTSPLMKRTSEGSETRSSGLGRASQPAGDSARADRRLDDSAWNVFPWNKARSDDKLSNGFMPRKPVTFSALASSRPIINSFPSIDGDDFERIDADDDLFAFDEDIGAEKHAYQEKEKPEGGLESDEEEANGGALPTSSPHAGSLPIEIKWPSRLVANG